MKCVKIKYIWYISPTWGSVYVASVLEEVVRFNVDEVWGKVPDILPVVYNAYHMIPTWKERRQVGRLKK